MVAVGMAQASKMHFKSFFLLSKFQLLLKFPYFMLEQFFNTTENTSCVQYFISLPQNKTRPVKFQVSISLLLAKIIVLYHF